MQHRSVVGVCITDDVVEIPRVQVEHYLEVQHRSVVGVRIADDVVEIARVQVEQDQRALGVAGQETGPVRADGKGRHRALARLLQTPLQGLPRINEYLFINKYIICY